MKRILKRVGRVLGWALLGLGVGVLGAKWMLHRSPPDPDEPPRGYAGPRWLYAAYLLGELPLVDRSPPVPAGVREQSGVEYGRVGDRRLLLDLYSPEKRSGPVPGLIFVHGGGWKSGKREDYRVYTTHFAGLGYVAASISYRLVPGARFPAPVEDAKCAVRWMRSHATELGVDPDRIAILGGSAGGHIALMVGYATNRPEWEVSGGLTNVSSRVAAVVNFYGPANMTTPFAQGSDLVRHFLGGRSFAEAPELYREASPVFHLRPGAPPTLTFHGTMDDIVPVDQADELEARLTLLGVPHEYERLEGWPHTMDVARPVNDYAKRRMESFLRRYLGAPPVSR